MAKKKTKHPVRRHRRMGAAPSGEIVNIVAILGGVVVGRLASKKVLTTIDDKIKGVAMAGIGFIGAKKIKSPIAKAFLTGFAVSGGELLFTSLGVISGIGNAPNTFNEGLKMVGQGGKAIPQMVGRYMPKGAIAN